MSRNLYQIVVAVALVAVLSPKTQAVAQRLVQQKRQTSSCGNSSNCQPGQCCRDSAGRALVYDPESWDAPLDGGNLNNGVCVVGRAKRGERCDFTCQCAAGLECYRPLTGRCCAPRSCITKAEAEAERWRRRCGPFPVRRRRMALVDSDCRFPPMPPQALSQAQAPGAPSP